VVFFTLTLRVGVMRSRCRSVTLVVRPVDWRVA